MTGAPGTSETVDPAPRRPPDTRAVALVLVLALLASGWVMAQQSIDYRRHFWPEDYPVMFLPSGQYLKAVSLGYDTLLADLIYLWSIQFYARTTEEGIRYLWHIYDVVTDLDPHYVDAYTTGAMIMAWQVGEPEMALRLLEKGMEHNPDEWILPLDAGFYCYETLEDYSRAAEYFDRATAIPGSPEFIARLRAGMYEYAGDLETSLRFWREVYASAEAGDDEQVMSVAWQHVYDLRVRLDKTRIREVVERFAADRGRWPDSLEELVRAGYLRRVPVNPTGEPYRWDPDAGEVVDPGGERPRSNR